MLHHSVVPPFDGVRLEPVRLENGRYVLVMFVPFRGVRPPAFSKVKAEVPAYYFRIGESMRAIPSTVLASMFGVHLITREQRATGWDLRLRAGARHDLAVTTRYRLDPEAIARMEADTSKMATLLAHATVTET